MRVCAIVQLLNEKIEIDSEVELGSIAISNKLCYNYPRWRRETATAQLCTFLHL